MHGCFNLVYTWVIVSLFCFFSHVSTVGFFFLWKSHGNTFALILTSCIAVSFQRPKRINGHQRHVCFLRINGSVRPIPDPLCLAAIELIQAFLPNKYDQSCRSFLAGVDPCRRPFGNHKDCHGLSFDLSSVLSSMCHSRDLILEINH